MPWKPRRPCSQCSNLQPCALHPVRGRWEGRGSPASRGYGWAWQQQRKLALERDGYRCLTCGAMATQVDHVVPKHKGGTDDLANLASKCDGCANTKTGREGQARR